jgi:hypothetical protein
MCSLFPWQHGISYFFASEIYTFHISCVESKNAYSGLEFFGIRFRVFLKTPEIFFKNGQNGLDTR